MSSASSLSAAPKQTASLATTGNGAAWPDAAAPKRCSAAGSSKLIMLAKLPGQAIGLALEGEHLFVAVTSYRPDRPYGVYRSWSRILRLGKSPGEPREIHKLEGKWPALSLSAGADGVYFTVEGVLHRVARDGSKHETLVEKFTGAITLYDRYVYGAGYDKEKHLLRIVRVARTGGEVVELFSGRPGKRYPDMAPLAQDIAVDATGVYVADESQRRVMKLSHEDHQLTVLGADEHYAGEILLGENAVYWRNGEYLRMVSKKGGEVRRAGEVRCWRMPLAMWGDRVYSMRSEVSGGPRCFSPFSLIALTPARGTVEILNKMEWPILTEVEVDEDCLYLARAEGLEPGETWVQARGRTAGPE